MHTILLADDNPDELKELNEILENTKKFRVKTAVSPGTALELLQPKYIKAAVIDFRLNGGANDDESGLLLAQNASRDIPKIMITALASEKQIRASIAADGGGRQIVFEFLSKPEIREDPSRLVRALERAIAARTMWDRKERESVQGQLLADYKNARWFDIVNTVVSFLVNAIFISLLILTVSYSHTGEVALILTSFISIGVIVGEIAVNLLLAKRIEGSSRRAENYHAELLQAWRFEQLLKSADGLDFINVRNQAKHDVIKTFAGRWNYDNRTPDATPSDRP